MKFAKQFNLLLFPLLLISFPIFLGLTFPPDFTPKNQPSKTSFLYNSKNHPENLIISCLDVSNGKIKEVNLEEYLPGVLAAEMPAEYEIEALKAQSVAARSYIMSRINVSSAEHPDANICNNPNHCKAYIKKEEAMNKWKNEDKNFYWEKLCSAVNSTQGEYMVYDGEVVEAFFFANSGGRTESSEDIWGGKRPYLRSVSSEWDISSPDALSTKTVPSEEFWNILKSQNPSTLPNTDSLINKNINRTEGGSVSEIVLGGQKFKGTEIRKLFDLKSSNFDINFDEDTVTFSVSGHGHGVGMSQYGANCMAKEGQKYTEILSHYYTNIQIVKI